MNGAEEGGPAGQFSCKLIKEIKEGCAEKGHMNKEGRKQGRNRLWIIRVFQEEGTAGAKARGLIRGTASAGVAGEDQGRVRAERSSVTGPAGSWEAPGGAWTFLRGEWVALGGLRAEKDHVMT